MDTWDFPHKGRSQYPPARDKDEMRRHLGAPVFTMKANITKKSTVRDGLRILRMKYHPFIYNNVKLLRVVDGDTVELEVNLGYHLTFRDRFRLAGIDAPETNRKATRPQGERSKMALEQMLLEEIDEGDGIWIESFKKDSFGRWLCVIHSHKNGNNLNEKMVTEGYAVPYKR